MVEIALRQVVLDTTDLWGLAAFYQQLLGWDFRPGDEPTIEDAADAEYVALLGPGGGRLLFQRIPDLPAATWPEGPVPQQMHLDFTIADRPALEEAHELAVSLGARVLRDLRDDPEEAIIVYADPAGHPFCLFLPA